ncbi:MAG: TonB-dependent receptor [Prevotella sp.]|nr:TonB-dependent receptor [Prevotella sp.]
MLNFKALQKPLLVLFLLCLLPLGMLAQGTVRGTVIDAAGEPIIGASVKVLGTNGGGVTDVNGQFNVQAARDAQLEISYVGYITQRVSVGGRQNINVTLQEDSQTLNDVVVIGYGTARRSDISGSVASIDAEQMLKRVPINLSDGLKGAAPGVIVTQQDGSPDALAQVRIRGVGTINGSADPLYVVDGVQVGNNANFLNPQDIESIEILKDASATAIYGSRGANGVVMITTKHGSRGAVHVEASANWGIQTVSHYFDTVGPDDYAASIRLARAATGGEPGMAIWRAEYDGQRKFIDWQKEMTRSALRQNYTLTASGGNDKMQGNFSAGYMDNQGVVVNTSYRRMNLRGTFKAQVADFIEVGGDLNFTHGISRGSNRGINNNGNLSSMRDYASLPPTMDYIVENTDENGNVVKRIVSPNVVNADGTYGVYQYISGANSELLGGQDNYYAAQMSLDNPSRNNRLLANMYADITLLKGLHLKSIFSYDYTSNDSYSWTVPSYRYNEGVEYYVANGGNANNSFNLSQSTGYSKGIETYLTYNWSNDKHDITAMLGNSVSKSYGYWVSAGANSFPEDGMIRDLGLTNNMDSRDGNGAFNAQTRFISYFGRVMYGFMNRYNLTATIRRDGSSNFGPGNRWGTFPSVAASWRISEESFMQDIDAVQNLKLRIGWGQTGNAGGATNLSVNQLSTASNMYHFYSLGGANNSFTTVNGMAYSKVIDTNLKWETNEQWNVGLDFTLLGGDLSVALDYFVRYSKDMLLYKSVRRSTGFDNVYTNSGEIRNRGFEFSLNYNKRLNNDWTIGATLTGSTLSNKITKLDEDIFNDCGGGNDGTTIDGSNAQTVDTNGFFWSNHSVCREGYAVGSYYGYVTDGIFRSQEEIDAMNANARNIAKANNPALTDADVQDLYAQNRFTAPGDVRFKDLNGDGIIDDNDMTIIGNGFPTFNYGLTLTANYKNWDFSIYTYGVFGQDILSYSAMRLETIGSGDESKNAVLKDAFHDSWTAQNPNATLPRLTILDNNHNTRCSDMWVKNGNFFKINNVQIGYTFPRNLIAPLKLTSARINLSVSNLLTISNYNKYGDPECGQGSLVFTGLDTGRYPSPRTYAVGLNVRF